MSYPSFTAQAREAFGSKAACQLRAGGRVPVTVATSGGASRHLSIDGKDAAQITTLVGRVILFDVDGSSQQLLIKDYVRHPTTDDIQHIDGLAVDDDKMVKVAVPVVPLTADCPGLKAGGLVEQMLRRVTIACPAKEIPEQVTISLAGVQITQTVYAKDVSLPESATLITKPRTAILTIIKTRGMRRAEALAKQDGD